MDDEVRKREEWSDAYSKGFSAAGFAADVSANPYQPGTLEYAEWAEGHAQFNKETK